MGNEVHLLEIAIIFVELDYGNLRIVRNDVPWPDGCLPVP